MSGVYDFSGGFNAINNAINGLDTTLRERSKQRAMAGIGEQVARGDYNGAAQKLFNMGDLASGLKLADMGRSVQQQTEANRAFSDLSQPATRTASVNIGSPNEVEDRFMRGARESGLTNPMGQAVVAAYGRAESGFAPGNVNRSWSDPSQSGKAGTSGGIMSWRNERLERMYKFAEARGEQRGNISPETQAAFLVAENPQLLQQLNNARTPEEANRIMANAWRFAGYNQAGGENARRLALTQQYAQRNGAMQQADIPAAGATPAQFNQANNQGRIMQLQRVLAMPGITDGQRQIVKTELEQLVKMSDPLYQAQLARAQQNEMPADVRSLQWRAQESGLQPGTQEYRDFISQGGRAQRDSATEQRIERLTQDLISTGTVGDLAMARSTAIGIADGRLRASRHPVTGQVQVVDLATGQPVTAAPQPASQVEAQAQQAPATTSINAGGPQYTSSGQSFGIPGAIARGVNVVTDVTNIGTAFPQVQSTQSDFRVLREGLLSDIADNYGRQPPSWLLKRIQDLTPDVDSVTEGVGSASNKLSSLAREFERERKNVVSSLGRELTPTMRQELEGRLIGIDAALSRTNEALQSFGGSAQGSGILPSNSSPGAANNAASPAEGAIADNPQTGQSIIFKNGKWEPLQ